MNYIDEVEKVLKNYRHLEKSVENLSRRIRRLNICNTSTNITAQLEPTGIKKNFAPPNAIDQLCEFATLRSEREDTIEKINEIDEILEDISKDPGCKFYGLVLKKWYIEKVPKDKIAGEIGYESKTSIYQIKKDALNLFAVQWFGINALVAM